MGGASFGWRANWSNARIVRAILGLFNAFSILAFRNGIARAFGRNVANWYVLLQACQFHVIYYASRTLPNMFAFGLSKIVQLLWWCGRSAEYI